MEQKSKKFEELNRYERAMATASLEQRLEAMANDLKQMALALGTSISVDATFHNWQEHDSAEKTHASVVVWFPSNCPATKGEVKEPGDLFGIIEKALGKPTKTPTEE